MAKKKTTTTKTTKAKPRGRPATKAKQKAKQRPKVSKRTTASSAKPHQLKQPTMKAGTTSINLLSNISRATASVKRPPNNPEVPQAVIAHLNTMLNDLLTILENFAQHLRALDRKRLNGVGIKKLGFIERAYEIALENPEFLPHYLDLERFGTDIQYFMDFRSLTDLCSQVREKLWNITIQAADFAYTDALDYYTPVKEAAKRRVDAAESIFAELSPFFKHMGRRTADSEAEPTKKQTRREFNALQRGTLSGKMEVVNIKPKLTGGVHKVIDETFKDTAEFKETEEGKIQE